MEEYKVSVIIPAYNSASTLRKCIDSVLSQSYSNIEVIVVDDGSTDQTLDIARGYTSNVIVYSQANKGACAARNFGVNKSTGDFIKFLDSDDFLSSEAISSQVFFVKNAHENNIYYGYRKVLYDTKLSEHKYKISLDSQFVELINNNITITLPLHRRKTLISIGLFDEKLQFRQEWDLHLRLASQGYVFLYHDVFVFTQVITDSPVRISSRALSLENEIKNLDYIRLKYDFMNDEYVRSAWALKYWTLGRQFLKVGLKREAMTVFDIARKISPENYLKLQPSLYKFLMALFGPSVAEKFISLNRILKK